MTKSQLASGCLMAVTGFNHYSLAYFSWQGAYEVAIAAYHTRMSEIRATERDASERDRLYGEAMDKLDDAIIEATGTYYSKDKDGNWTEAEQAPAPATPVLVVSNDDKPDADEHDEEVELHHAEGEQPALTAAVG